MTTQSIKPIWKTIALATVFLPTVTVFGNDYGIGNHSFYNSDRALQRKNFDTLRQVETLRGEVLSNERVVVQGSGRTTIVNGVIATNSTRITDTDSAGMLHIRCPANGGQVIIRGTQMINHGRIRAAGMNATAGMMLIHCNKNSSKTVSIIKTKAINNGDIRTFGK